MKTLVKAFAVTTAMTTSTIAPIQAHAAIETLGECYQAVINWCNETFPDADCSQASGLDDCDEVFGNAVGGMNINQIYIQTHADGSKSLRFETSVPEVEDEDDRRGRDRDRDDDKDREPTRRPSGDERDPTGAPTRD